MELIRDNYEKIKAWIASQELKPYEAYHVMWLKRRKDGVTDKGSQAGKHWFIHNVAELERPLPICHDGSPVPPSRDKITGYIN